MSHRKCGAGELCTTPISTSLPLVCRTTSLSQLLLGVHLLTWLFWSGVCPICHQECESEWGWVRASYAVPTHAVWYCAHSGLLWAVHATRLRRQHLAAHHSLYDCGMLLSQLNFSGCCGFHCQGLCIRMQRPAAYLWMFAGPSVVPDMHALKCTLCRRCM